MRHRPDSIPIAHAQSQLGRLVTRLRQIDNDLTRLAGGILVREGESLSEVVRGTIEVVHTDLLADALETLSKLTSLREDEALECRTLALVALQPLAIGG